MIRIQGIEPLRIGIGVGIDARAGSHVDTFDGVAELARAEGHEPISIGLSSARDLSPFELGGLLLYDSGSYDAIEVCRRLRAARSSAVILVVAQQFDREYARRAFEAGCDDYLLAPIAAQTLLDRLQIITVRNDSVPLPVGDLTLGGLRIDAFDRVWLGKSLQRLPRKEVALLRCLAAMRGELVRYEQLIVAGWGDMNLGSNTLEVHVSRLRRWLNGVLGPGALDIRAVRGVGYLLAS